MEVPSGGKMTPPTIRESPTPEVTNIAKTGGVTRSGRIIVPKGLWNKDLTPAKKEKAMKAPKKVVTEEEAHEFLKMFCHTTQDTTTNFTSFIANQKSHRELVLKVLNDAYVPQDITLEKLKGIINNITVSHHLSFSEEEVPAEGGNHNQPLHIVIKYRGYMIAKVLIDNGSSLNVMPKATLDKLYYPNATLNAAQWWLGLLTATNER
ncbi:hypothetical protein CR513_50436, partial [Mucuna pruriens]